jgi:serine/threonine protein kinase/Flp pilus assembly protein TadD
LLAHFEENQEFYLAQEFVEGNPLIDELTEGQSWTESQVIAFLRDVLRVLSFVHQQHVIHRDLKPSNLIRRRRDGRMVLIDFGAVKQVGVQNFDPDTGLTNITISIGTKGFMPSEQLAGKPRFSSDIYALGVLAVQALTGIAPKKLQEDASGEVAWHDHAPKITTELRNILERMVRYDFRARYSTATETLEAIESLPPSLLQAAESAAAKWVPLPRVQVRRPSSDRTAVSELNAWLNGHTAIVEVESDQPTTAGEGEPLSTALWQPPAAFLQAHRENPPLVSMAGAGANLTYEPTQAVGRPYHARRSINHTLAIPPGHITTTQKRIRSTLWSGIVIAALLGTAAATLSPQFPKLLSQVPQVPVVPPLPKIEPTKSSDPKERATQLYKEANQAMEQQDFAKALVAYDQAIKLRPNYAEAYAGRCEALNRLKRPEEAMVSCADALAYKQNYPEALWSRGNALFLQNRRIEALQVYEKVTDLKPEFVEGWIKQAVTLQSLGRSSEALTATDRAIALHRDSAEAWKTRGDALLTLQRYDQAVIALDKALQLQPNDPEIQKLRQKASEQQGR